jgi:hypothetical protein
VINPLMMVVSSTRLAKVSMDELEGAETGLRLNPLNVFHIFVV